MQSLPEAAPTLVDAKVFCTHIHIVLGHLFSSVSSANPWLVMVATCRGELMDESSAFCRLCIYT